jgi:hypothetical protein
MQFERGDWLMRSQLGHTELICPFGLMASIVEFARCARMAVD